ncbi:MAG TPA: HD domain-containing protein [Candidatus Woesebacteria bacterium]|nr:HD domain-containing protein [Candidatus Woesebacteria bacterium]HPR99299.1 HD domain-containing protein [Candidatus Woesebacteria bacterium]
MEKRQLPEKVKIVMQKVLDKNGKIYVVGGAVRDWILKKEVNDWDFATNLTPEEMKKIFPKNSFCENQFGTFSVVVGKDEIFEITTYRSEAGYSDKRHPDKISWGKTLKEDLERRDFTINAIALDIEGQITDLHGGIEDLNNRLIKTVGNPDDRFSEDALRMMRAIRIAAQIGFLIEEKTFESIQKNAHLIKEIAGERIRDELFKILLSKKPGDGIRLLKNSGLLAEIMPELLLGVGMGQKGHHIYDVWDHELEALNNCQSKNPVTRLACLLHDVGKPVVMKEEKGEKTFYNHEVVGSRIAVNIGKRLRLSKDELEQLFILVRWHMFTVEDTQTDKAVRRFIRNVTPKYLDEMISLRRSDRLGSGAKESSWRWELFKKRLIEVQKQPFSVKDLKVNGLDVMEILKIKPSRKVGEVLDKLFAEVEEKPELNVREILLEKIKKFT